MENKDFDMALEGMDACLQSPECTDLGEEAPTEETEA